MNKVHISFNPNKIWKCKTQSKNVKHNPTVCKTNKISLFLSKNDKERKSNKTKTRYQIGNENKIMQIRVERQKLLGFQWKMKWCMDIKK